MRVEGSVVVLIRLQVEMIESKGCRTVGALVRQSIGGGVETVSEGLCVGVGGLDPAQGEGGEPEKQKPAISNMNLT